MEDVSTSVLPLCENAAYNPADTGFLLHSGFLFLASDQRDGLGPLVQLDVVSVPPEQFSIPPGTVRLLLPERVRAAVRLLPHAR
eukprot:CAMPEP_0194338104 /NCGR_PEP_ID=MMETSP0171-20130528/78405_1 /TAXON_ID=218684 /ORGANISM="Corethron pennatum, Strain L29A3" /LENGTH=83 /DNA_ID=CAMNT_0039102109 /DNA_START=85 /DNA_END=332 /DNA_ORIENTATION=-